MESTYHTLTITIYNQDKAYSKVGELLHEFSDKILLRVGYPIKHKNTAVIFLMLEMTNNELGALSGKLGQLESVKVKSISLKI